MITLGDGIEGLCSLEGGSVSLLLSDLPSGETQAEFDTPPDLERFWAAAWHALKPDGVAVLMASSFRFAARVIESQSARFRYDLIWRKSLATGHLNAKHRPLRAHEFLLVFARTTSTYRPQMTSGHTPMHAMTQRNAGENYGATNKAIPSNAGATDRYPISVLEFASVGTSSKERTHPQQKPEPLLRWCVRTYSNSDELIVDPYAGSGSAGRAAFAEGRRFIGWDSSPRFGR